MSDPTSYPPSPEDPTRPVSPPSETPSLPDATAPVPPPPPAMPSIPDATAPVPPPAAYPTPPAAPQPPAVSYQNMPPANPYASGSSMGGMVEHPQGTTVLIMGILSLVVCGFLGPFAWMQGNKALAEIDANPGRYSNRSNVNAGRICGMIATAILIAGAVFVLLFLVLGGIAAVSTN